MPTLAVLHGIRAGRSSSASSAGGCRGPAGDSAARASGVEQLLLLGQAGLVVADHAHDALLAPPPPSLQLTGCVGWPGTGQEMLLAGGMDVGQLLSSRSCVV